MAAELRRHGVKHALVTVEGTEHGLADVDPAREDEAHGRAVAFPAEHLG